MVKCILCKVSRKVSEEVVFKSLAERCKRTSQSIRKEWSMLKDREVHPSDTGEFTVCSVRRPVKLK